MSTATNVAPLAKVVLIDLSALFWSAWHSSGNDEISMARVRTLDSVRRCCEPGVLAAVCCDSGKSFRKDILPSYKAQRPEKDHAVLGELDRVKAQLRKDGFLLWEAAGFEADDVIASAAKLAVAAGHEVLICSGDKDLLQLVDGSAVRCLRTNTWKVVGSVEVMEKFGVSSMQLGDWLALVGDKSDNIPGAPGIGEKTATALLQKYGNLTALFAVLEGAPADVKEAVPRVDPAKLNAAYEDVMTARKLIALRDDLPIKFEQLYQERRPERIAKEDRPMPNEDDDERQGQSEPQPMAASDVRKAFMDVKPEPTAAPQERALTVVQPSFELQLEPTGIKGALWLAQGLYESRLYSRFTNAEAIMAVIIRGREMGLGALTSLDCFHVIEGKPAPHAMLIIARAKADPDCDYFQCIETSSKSATWETKNKRNPKPTRLTYTIEQAQAAGLLGKPNSNWTKRPDEMIRKTCGVQLARIEYPEASLGLYAQEELE